MKSFKINDSSVDWLSRESHIFFDPRHPQARKWRELPGKIPFFSGHIYLFASSAGKLIALSKEAFLVSARAVNDHLGCDRTDRWLIPLPLTHVAGLSVSARGFCGSFSCVKLKGKWDPENFLNALKREKITLSSLVPAQVYDLVTAHLSPPKTLRAVIVGGGAVSEALYLRARALGWPLLPSYGLTELCSQVATAEPLSLNENKFPRLKILSHVKVKREKGTLRIRSKALLTGYIYRSCLNFPYQTKRERHKFSNKDIPSAVKFSEIFIREKTGKLKSDRYMFWDPKSSDGWFDTGDLGEVCGSDLKVKGRKENQIKILGELTDLTDLSRRLESLITSLSFKGRVVLLAVPQERKGRDLQLVTTSFNEAEIFKLIREFNVGVPSFLRITKSYSVPKMPQTDILKVSLPALKKQIGLDTDSSLLS